MTTLHESAHDIAVVYSCDVCVIGGGCTGVFAAVRAAQPGRDDYLDPRAAASKTDEVTHRCAA